MKTKTRMSASYGSGGESSDGVRSPSVAEPLDTMPV
ncbi:MAG: hypothetical protein BWX50_01215 [Euryarchaeota archaeon ADurb.Bin009]|nr:MAG: hypothetical protein BWX50_01215 [Euryarchaeota archaeon ADurb.Bin009]